MKCKFKTNKILTALKETDHIVTTADGKVIHKKLESNPLKFLLSKRSEETRKPTNQCRRCGWFSQEEYCESHKQLMAESASKIKQQEEAGTSKSFPETPMREPEEHTVIMVTTDNQTTDGAKSAHIEENSP